MRFLIRDFSGATYTPTRADWLLSDGSQPRLTIWASNFSAGTVTVEMSPDGGTTWISLTKISDGMPAIFIANAQVVCYAIPQGYYIRGTVTGATTAANVNATIG